MVDGLRGQANYHRNTNSQLGGMADRLHRITAALFYVTFALALIHLSIETIPTFEDWFPKWIAKGVTLLTVLFPALDATLHAVSAQGEYETLAKRSAAMAAILRHIVDSADTQRAKQNRADGAILRTATDQAVAAMGPELIDWRAAVTFRGPELPEVIHGVSHG